MVQLLSVLWLANLSYTGRGIIENDTKFKHMIVVMLTVKVLVARCSLLGCSLLCHVDHDRGAHGHSAHGQSYTRGRDVRGQEYGQGTHSLRSMFYNTFAFPVFHGMLLVAKCYLVLFLKDASSISRK